RGQRLDADARPDLRALLFLSPSGGGAAGAPARCLRTFPDDAMSPAASSMLPKKDWSAEPRRALSATETVTQLAQLPGWQLHGDGADVAIEKTFRFANYHETMAFVNAVAFIAHVQDHHPDLSVHYDRCVVRFN